MRQTTKPVHLAILALLMSLVTADPGNTTWNYDQNGKDWGQQFPMCSYPIQSPVDIKFDWETYGKQTPENPDYFLTNWNEIPFIFFPEMFEANVGTSGFKDWVYQMSEFGTKPGAGGWIAGEPFGNKMNPQIVYEIESIRFHHPAEHKINGTTYDLEMQVFGKDLYGRHIICDGDSAISLFFNIDDSSTSDFFDWQAKATAGEQFAIDLKKVLPQATMKNNNIYGYKGTDTMPGCQGVCWYIVETPLPITTAQRDFFIYENNPSNARSTDIGLDTWTKFFFSYGDQAPKPTPPSTNVLEPASFLQF